MINIIVVYWKRKKKNCVLHSLRLMCALECYLRKKTSILVLDNNRCIKSYIMVDFYFVKQKGMPRVLYISSLNPMHYSYMHNYMWLHVIVVCLNSSCMLVVSILSALVLLVWNIGLIKLKTGKKNYHSWFCCFNCHSLI
jgi:hypothetical protein